MALRDGFLGIGHEWDVGHKAGIGDARREPGLVDLEPLLVVPRGHGLLVYRLPGRYPALLGGTWYGVVKETGKYGTHHVWVS